MPESEEIWYFLPGINPRQVHESVLLKDSPLPLNKNPELPFFLRIKEWLFPPQHEYPLPIRQIDQYKFL
ncbi:MAG: hypothetical protein CVU39_20800 [Chloroflexi bacterium HGW-Chloroflexi-10]|nr:MAG: hypothetical protein CVU39_20800 [Chloroflexi bacterium HGW-Chloroflexi-10]